MELWGKYSARVQAAEERMGGEEAEEVRHACARHACADPPRTLCSSPTFSSGFLTVACRVCISVCPCVQMDEEDRYLARLEGGLFTLQMARCCALLCSCPVVLCCVAMLWCAH